MAIEIVDLPIKNGDLNHSYVNLPEGIQPLWSTMINYGCSTRLNQRYMQASEVLKSAMTSQEARGTPQGKEVGAGQHGNHRHIMVNHL